MTKAGAGTKAVLCIMLSVTTFLILSATIARGQEQTPPVSAQHFQQLQADVQRIRVVCAELRMMIRKLQRRVAALEPEPASETEPELPPSAQDSAISISSFVARMKALGGPKVTDLQRVEAQAVLQEIMVAGRGKVLSVAPTAPGSRRTRVSLATGPQAGTPILRFEFDWEAARKLRIGQIVNYRGQIAAVDDIANPLRIRLVKVTIE